MYLSVVIPVYNEQDNLPLLFDALKEALKPIEQPWEVILVDDGSKDKSPEILEAIANEDPEHYRAVIFRRNFGQTTAIAAGIDFSQGDIVVLMDADMQNDPADIPAMVAEIENGFDVVSGWRINRQDTFIRRFPSKIANGLISSVTGVHLHDYGCTLKAYRREVITGFRLYGEMHRFIPAFAALVGARITEMPVHHHARKFGKANYGLERTLKVVLDLLTVKFLNSYANKPIYLFGGTGVSMIGLSLVTLLILIEQRIFAGEHMIRSPLLSMAAMLFTLGFMSILMGLMAEMLNRTYHESQNKPTYTVRKVINAEENNHPHPNNNGLSH